MSSQMMNIIITMWADELASIAKTIKIDSDCQPLVEVKAESLLRLAQNMRGTAEARMTGEIKNGLF